MKILMMGTLTNSMNGSARSFVRLCNFLASKHDVYVVVPDTDGVVSLLSNDICQLLVKNLTPVRRSIASVLSIPLSIVRLFTLIKKYQPDIIHINDIPWFYGVMVARWLKTPVVIHSRYYEKNKVIKKVISVFVGTANAAIYVSDFNRRMWGVTKGLHYTLHNPGIFNFKFDDSFNLPPNYALVVSRVSEEKGIREAIELFSILAKLDSSMQLIIAGDALYHYQKVYLEQCKDLLKHLGLKDRVVWLGHVSMPHALYRNTKLYIHLPNFEDPFPTTVMEALALGSRILTNGRGGIKEQIEGFEGTCLIEPSSSDQETESKLIQFMNATESKYDRSDLYAKRFDEQRFYEKFEEILLSVNRQSQGPN
ncbi:glycosyltransferase family 4 protein [Methylicorpusculum sp.]|uniref:glycosyltransferase family 4 protein n=1 Tax=Methylicorpusculum sp. TaxID=2713644 RepID=UPI002AB86F5D|nr:glycosyltransferase family 4 protein [Methylicorpusculum sp.]MDZ4154087.1 glycosyltransferase family 4 protein [Methylicorpusculum sp.]